ncbi:hypothetical protein [Trueperella abortisuis]|uniref:3-oxoacyl-ACP reductase-like protein n=1 Tax=Trueperella abortisuis TaxID=445930 RepID=A0ABT9PKG0_9ACTO|nr:hypothetical protein [Trueperella abortisuis]MDP9833211.1 3-oxoacyl-ACP reductase-like protein [Trueperella abortisuis]
MSDFSLCFGAGQLSLKDHDAAGAAPAAAGAAPAAAGAAPAAAGTAPAAAGVGNG